MTDSRTRNLCNTHNVFDSRRSWHNIAHVSRRRIYNTLHKVEKNSEIIGWFTYSSFQFCGLTKLMGRYLFRCYMRLLDITHPFIIGEELATILGTFSVLPE